MPTIAIFGIPYIYTRYPSQPYIESYIWSHNKLTVGIGKRQHQVLESKRVNAYMLENCGNYALAVDWKMISSYMAHKMLATVCMLEI